MPRFTSVRCGIFIHSAVWPQQTSPKKFAEGGYAVLCTSSSVAKVTWADGYLHTKPYLDPCNHLAAIHVDQKLGTPLPFSGGLQAPHLTESRLR